MVLLMAERSERSIAQRTSGGDLVIFNKILCYLSFCLGVSDFESALDFFFVVPFCFAFKALLNRRLRVQAGAEMGGFGSFLLYLFAFLCQPCSYYLEKGQKRGFSGWPSFILVFDFDTTVLLGTVLFRFDTSFFRFLDLFVLVLYFRAFLFAYSRSW